MLEKVDVGRIHIDAYEESAGKEAIDELKELAKPLRGVRLLHLNATPFGGGVAEILRAEVPLLRSLGIEADWRILTGGEPFFRATKAIHNGLQGASTQLAKSDREVYLENNERNAQLLDDDYDLFFIHDPQPAGILNFHDKGDRKWIWRCHLDTSEPNPAVWEFLREHLGAYDAAVFTLDTFVPPDLPIGRVEIIPPGIDPISPKNTTLPNELATEVVGWLGVRTEDPLVCQVSRFDRWKDPQGVMRAYWLAKEEIPRLQLALVGSMAFDDPEGWEIYRELREEGEPDPDLFLFTNLTGVGNIEVNAFQRMADAVIQLSIREGFGLVVAETLWKGTPVIARSTGGIPLQMEDGVGGVLVETVEECAAALVSLVRDPKRARELGRRGRERVRERFLLTRLIADELRLMRSLLEIT